jgi:hypothetical protein
MLIGRASLMFVLECRLVEIPLKLIVTVLTIGLTVKRVC